MIEGLAQTSGNYAEAITCLQKRYDRPRLIHQAHIRAVIEAPPLRDGTGKELRHVHDVINHHTCMRAITAMADNSLEAFVTSIIESTLDQTSMFACQDYSHDRREVPPYETLLEFLDRHARATVILFAKASRNIWEWFLKGELPQNPLTRPVWKKLA